MMSPTRREVEEARTPKGGYKRAQLAEWGVRWPPPSGWRKRLLREADQRDGTHPPLTSPKRVGTVGPGQQHPYWPEWTWTGEKFVRT